MKISRSELEQIIEEEFQKMTLDEGAAGLWKALARALKNKKLDRAKTKVIRPQPPAVKKHKDPVTPLSDKDIEIVEPWDMNQADREAIVQDKVNRFLKDLPEPERHYSLPPKRKGPPPLDTQVDIPVTRVQRHNKLKETNTMAKTTLKDLIRDHLRRESLEVAKSPTTLKDLIREVLAEEATVVGGDKIRQKLRRQGALAALDSDVARRLLDPETAKAMDDLDATGKEQERAGKVAHDLAKLKKVRMPDLPRGVEEAVAPADRKAMDDLDATGKEQERAAKVADNLAKLKKMRMPNVGTGVERQPGRLRPDIEHATDPAVVGPGSHAPIPDNSYNKLRGLGEPTKQVPMEITPGKKQDVSTRYITRKVGKYEGPDVTGPAEDKAKADPKGNSAKRWAFRLARKAGAKIFIFKNKAYRMG